MASFKETGEIGYSRFNKVKLCGLKSIDLFLKCRNTHRVSLLLCLDEPGCVCTGGVVPKIVTPLNLISPGGSPTYLGDKTTKHTIDT